jgi:hypothetical protein
MIKRNLLMNNAISRESLSKFIKELAKRSDNACFVGGTAPIIASLLVDAIELWEAEKWRFLTMADNARLNPEAHVFPNSTPLHMRP